MSLVVDAHQIGKKYHRIEIRVDGEYIGVYERSQAQDIDRKTQEIQCALDTLLPLFQRHGELKVRWIGKRREKIIFAGANEVGVVPRQCWRTPSWEQR